MHPYYAERQPAIEHDFERCFQVVRPDFERELPEHQIDELLPLFRAELQRRVASLPYVGGAQARMTPFFEQATGFFAVGRVLRSLGVPMDKTQLLMRKIFLVRLNSLSTAQRLALGKRWLSPENQAHLRAEAEASRLEQHPGDFVYRFVEAADTEAGENFTFGIDYTQCGFCKLAKAQQDEDLLPVMCSLDEEIYALRGVRLVRTMTIASGGSHCNFRFGEMPPASASEAAPASHATPVPAQRDKD